MMPWWSWERAGRRQHDRYLARVHFKCHSQTGKVMKKIEQVAPGLWQWSWSLILWPFGWWQQEFCSSHPTFWSGSVGKKLSFCHKRDEPRNCILVAWGFETQMRLLWTKIDFVVAAPRPTIRWNLSSNIIEARVLSKEMYLSLEWTYWPHYVMSIIRLYMCLLTYMCKTI